MADVYTDLFDSLIVTNKTRSKSPHGGREQLKQELSMYNPDRVTDEIDLKDDQGRDLSTILRDNERSITRSSSMHQNRRSADHGKPQFNRKTDRMNFKQDPNKVVQREYVDGTPLLMDLSKYLLSLFCSVSTL